MAKTIFITGGSTGIGAASVRKFIAQGWNVGFMDINTEAASALVAELNCPDRLLFTEGNTRIRSDIHRAVKNTVAKFGQLDSVFANAGIHRANTLLDIADEELDLMIQTNAAIYSQTSLLRKMRKRKILDIEINKAKESSDSKTCKLKIHTHMSKHEKRKKEKF